MKVMEYRCSHCETTYAAFCTMPKVCITCRSPDIDTRVKEYTDFSYYIGALDNKYFIVQPIGRRLLRMPTRWETLKYIECNHPDDIIDIDMWPGDIGGVRH